MMSSFAVTAQQTRHLLFEAVVRGFARGGGSRLAAGPCFAWHRPRIRWRQRLVFRQLRLRHRGEPRFRTAAVDPAAIVSADRAAERRLKSLRHLGPILV